MSSYSNIDYFNHYRNSLYHLDWLWWLVGLSNANHILADFFYRPNSQASSITRFKICLTTHKNILAYYTTILYLYFHYNCARRPEVRALFLAHEVRPHNIGLSLEASWRGLCASEQSEQHKPWHSFIDLKPLLYLSDLITIHSLPISGFHSHYRKTCITTIFPWSK